MKKYTISKKAVAIGLSLVLLLGTTAGIFAASNLQRIAADLNSGIKIIYNGTTQTLKDANGNQLFPISYNGTTYVPLRAVSTIFGENVNWDKNTNSITLGKSEREPISLTKLSHDKGTDTSGIIGDVTNIVPVNTQFSSGVFWSIWNSTMSYSYDYCMHFDVSAYSTLTYTAWSDVDATVMVVDENEANIDIFKLYANTITTRTIDISGVSKVAFGANALDFIQKPNTGTLYILDPTVK